MKEGLKQKIRSELIEYWTVVAYLAFFFGMFTWYQGLILVEQHIGYFHYGTAVFEALVLAKVILIGDALHLARRFEDRPLIVPTLYKAVGFSLWVAAFTVLERMVEGLLHHQGLAGAVEELLSTSKYKVLAKSLVTFSAFIPFFAFRELDQVLGTGRLYSLFFRGRALMASTPGR